MLIPKDQSVPKGLDRTTKKETKSIELSHRGPIIVRLQRRVSPKIPSLYRLVHSTICTLRVNKTIAF